MTKHTKKLTVFLILLTSVFVSCHKKNEHMNSRRYLRINMQKEPVSLDPRIGNDMASSQIHFMLFEGLVKLNADLTLSCAQAESYEILDEGKKYIFHLGNHQWSNGKPVVALDFERSWKSLLDPQSASPDSYLLYCVKNARKAKKGEVELSEVGIKAIDDKTLIVQLEFPSPHFLQIVASSVLLPVNLDAEQENLHWALSGSEENFISNGPFRLKERKLNREIVLEKNPFFHSTRRGNLDGISIEIIDREMAVLHMYASGHFDLIGAPLSFFPSIIHQDLEKRDLLSFFPVASTKFLAFNTESFPFNNTDLRRAFALSIDRKAIVQHITQLKEEEALRIIPSILSLTKEDLYSDADIAQAREAFERGVQQLKIKPGDLGNIKFIYVANEINHLIAQELQEQWSKVLGIKVSLENVEFKVLHDRSRKGDFDIGVFAWMADYSDPMNILERFQDPKSPRNYSKWHHDQYDVLIQRALAAPSKEEYGERICEAERFLAQEMPVATLYHGNYVFLIQPYIKNFSISPLGHIYFDQIILDESPSK